MLLVVVTVCGCVFHAFHVVWQFVNHDSDFEKTKLKLLDAANLVDKVRPSESGTGRKNTLQHHRLWIHFPFCSCSTTSP